MSTKLLLLSTGGLLPLVIIFLALAPPVRAATAGEILEKAIYAEETAGDLDEAIKLYEQVIAEAKTARSAAAKAQYRLGLIYEKQGKVEQAAEAFRAVIENYAEEEELVAQARKRLPSEVQLLPAPWVDGEELQLDMKLPTGHDIGTMVYRIESAPSEGKDAWQCTTRGLVTANGADSLSRVLCEKESFAPIKSFWMHSLLGEAEAVYSDDSVEINVVGKEKPLVIKISPPVYDNEQAMQLFRRLPLKVGYKTETSVVSSLGAGEVKLALEVPEIETIEVPAGKFECHKLELNIGQTFWISTDEHRYVVRFQAGGVTADLERMEQRDEDSTAELAGDGFSLTLPMGWHSYSPKGEEDDKKRTTHLLDPNAIVDSQINSGPLDSLKDEERVSAKAWSESAVKGLTKMLKGFKVRETGLHDVEAGGVTGTAMLADFTDDDTPMTMYGIGLFSGQRAVNLRFSAPSDKFEELRPEFDAIVKSLKVE